jgi:hypothetical protein
VGLLSRGRKVAGLTEALGAEKTSRTVLESELKRIQAALDELRAAAIDHEASRATLQRDLEAVRRECERVKDTASAREQEIGSLDRLLKAARAETREQCDLVAKLEGKWAAYADSEGGEERTFEKRADGTWWLSGPKANPELLTSNPEHLIKLIADFQADLDPAEQGYRGEEAEQARNPIKRCLEAIYKLDRPFSIFLETRIVRGSTRCYFGPPRQFKITLPPRSPD